jgi:hypothetical protein
MVKIIASVLSFAALVAAQDANDVGGRKFSAIVEMIMGKVTTALDAGTVSKMIQNYGCHCFPNADSASDRIIGGLGQPKDALDSQCRTLYRCKKCVDMEFPGACDVDQGKYKYTIDDAGNVDCSQNTGCQLAQCTCDKEFADQVGSFWADADHNGDYWLNKKHVQQQNNAGNAVFEYASDCVAQGTNVTPDACCGNSYPSKIPYATSNRACCATSARTYNSVTEECCADGSIKAPGTC